MARAIAPALTRLPRVPRASARLAMRLRPLLWADEEGAPERGREGGAIIEPIEAKEGEETLQWLRFSVDGREIFLRPDDDYCDPLGMEAARLIAWMPHVESLLARLEQRFGASLILREPIVDLDRRLARVRIQNAQGASRLAARSADLPASESPSALSAAAGAICAGGLLLLASRRLTSGDFARLRVGACLLVATNASRHVGARLAIEGRFYARGQFDLTARTFEALDAEAPAMDELSTGRAKEERGLMNGLSDVPVHIQVRLTGARVRFADLAALRPPALLPLEIEGEELEAEIHANGRPYAKGRVVALGDAYGVVVDALYGESL